VQSTECRVQSKDKSELEKIPLFCCGGLDNCGKSEKKGDFAQQTSVIAAAEGGAAAIEGELLRRGENSSELKVPSNTQNSNE
jgi:hypothetical protein